MAGLMRSCSMSRGRNDNEDFKIIYLHHALGFDWREVDEETEKDLIVKKIMLINLTKLMRISFMYLK